MKNKILYLIIGILVLVICATLFSYFKFKVINPISSGIGMIRILFTDTEYVEVQKNPKIVFSKPTNAMELLDTYMKNRGFENIKNEQMGAMIVYSNGNVKERVMFSANGYYSKWAWDSYVQSVNENKLQGLIVSESGTGEITKITTGEIAKKYKYNIYYYGLKNVDVKLTNKTIDLKEALQTNEITMEDIIEKAKNDGENGLLKYYDSYDDGGSRIYEYENYTIIKVNSLDGNRDVYIGMPTMRLLSSTSVTGYTLKDYLTRTAFNYLPNETKKLVINSSNPTITNLKIATALYSYVDINGKMKSLNKGKEIILVDFTKNVPYDPNNTVVIFDADTKAILGFGLVE
ncbi:MAG: hypothetical protein FWF46_00860 [Oscillospiraceae bacterium]|nr:hypothetical protein [Oscillospiraceae bacterium]